MLLWSSVFPAPRAKVCLTTLVRLRVLATPARPRRCVVLSVSPRPLAARRVLALLTSMRLVARFPLVVLRRSLAAGVSY